MRRTVDYGPVAEMALGNLTRRMPRIFKRISVSRYHARQIKKWAKEHGTTTSMIVDELIRAWLAHGMEERMPTGTTGYRTQKTRCPLSINADPRLWEMFREKTQDVRVGHIVDDMIGEFLTVVGGHE